VTFRGKVHILCKKRTPNDFYGLFEHLIIKKWTFLSNFLKMLDFFLLKNSKKRTFCPFVFFGEGGATAFPEHPHPPRTDLTPTLVRLKTFQMGARFTDYPWVFCKTGTAGSKNGDPLKGHLQHTKTGFKRSPFLGYPFYRLPRGIL